MVATSATRNVIQQSAHGDHAGIGWNVSRSAARTTIADVVAMFAVSSAPATRPRCGAIACCGKRVGPSGRSSGPMSARSPCRSPTSGRRSRNSIIGARRPAGQVSSASSSAM